MEELIIESFIYDTLSSNTKLQEILELSIAHFHYLLEGNASTSVFSVPILQLYVYTVVIFAVCYFFSFSSSVCLLLMDHQ